MAKKIVKKILNKWGLDLKGYKRELLQFEKLYKKYANFTMIPREQFISNLELCHCYKNLKGDYVECGVWRGGMSGAIAEVLGQNTPIHLFDSFEGLPPAKAIDGKEALAWQKDITSSNYYDNCRAEESYVIESMKLAKHKIHKIYKGWFDQTVPKFGDHTVAILRLDCDWYDSMIICLDQLFPKIVEGGIVILDDYHTWDGCAKAVHDYLSRTKSPSRLYQWNNRVAFIIKKN